MSEEKNGNNARGRARGRAREMLQEQPVPGQRSDPPRPVPAVQPQPQPGPLQAQQASTSTGRGRPLTQESGALCGAMQHGPGTSGSHGEQLGPGSEGAFSGAMQAMQLGPETPSCCGEQLGRGSRRGRRPFPEIILRTRPDSLQTKQGTSGKVVKLRSNHFPLLQRSTSRLYHYRVDFAPEIDDTHQRKALLRIHKEVLGGHIFDGTSLFRVHPLQTEPIELFSKRQSDEEIIRITVRLVGDVADGDAHYIQIYNTIMREALRYLGLKLVGRDYCDPDAKIEIRQFHLELWPKYVTTIRQYESQVMMCCDISTKKMSTKTLWDVLHKTIKENSQRYQEEFKKAVLGTIVLTTYNNNTYRVDDVDFTITPTSKFPWRGSEISYMKYYQVQHSILIKDPNQPMLVSKNSARKRRRGMDEFAMLVPELCKTTGLSEDMRNDFHLMRAIADSERQDPVSRIEKLERFNQRIQNNDEIQQLFTEQWEMSIARNLVEFDGRVLPQEIIIGGTKGTGSKKETVSYGAGPCADWTKSLFSSPMLSNIPLHNWAVITPGKCQRETELFVELIRQVGNGMQFLVSLPNYKVIANDLIGTYKEALDEVRHRYNPQLVLCVTLTNKADRYAMIKKETCCSNFVVPSQVILAKSINHKNRMSIATKVAIQMNCKIGGAPWSVNIPLKGLMVCGFDVCHDTVNRGKSYGALVCSLDSGMTRYFSVVSEHSNGEELSNFLATDMVKGLRKFHEVNNTLPQRIILYRDGVGDGQLPYVAAVEVDTLKARLRDVYQGNTYRLAVVVVTKRISTRIFKDKSNPEPGTIVDDCITLPEKYDFYLVSQSVRQGTVAPTSYNIISDNIGLDADKLQRLTYKLTHLYFNWSGTVRVPAPTQYAHKLAYLVGKHMHRMPSNVLEDKLYFL